MVRSELKLGNVSVRLAGSVKLSNCFLPCLQFRAGTDKHDTVDYRGKSIDVDVWCKQRSKNWFGSTMERIDHRVQDEFMARVAMRKLMT